MQRLRESRTWETPASARRLYALVRMPMSAVEPRPSAHEIGKLCVGGDWACAHGDLGALRHIARSLALHAEEPMHCELLELAEACRCDPDTAVARWMQIKDQLYRTDDA